MDRNRLYRLINIAWRQLGWSEAQYRNYLTLHGAAAVDERVSATTLSDTQLQAAYAGLRRAGFSPRRKQQSARGDWRRPRIDKITALWCALADAGVVHNRSALAMQRWCAGVTGVGKLEWCNSEQLNDCVERLKQWSRRERLSDAV